MYVWRTNDDKMKILLNCKQTCVLTGTFCAISDRKAETYMWMVGILSVYSVTALHKSSPLQSRECARKNSLVFLFSIQFALSVVSFSLYFSVTVEEKTITRRCSGFWLANFVTSSCKTRENALLVANRTNCRFSVMRVIFQLWRMIRSFCQEQNDNIAIWC